MKLPFQYLPSNRVRSGGLTLIELLVSISIGLVVIGSVVALSIISVQNFAAMSNYVQMNDQSRTALDLISREIRNATSVRDLGTNSMRYLELTNINKGLGATITFDPNAGTLTLDKTGAATKTLLTGCDSFGFQLFDRYPITSKTNVTFHASTNTVTGQIDKQFCKIIQFNWKCSRKILGSKLNTEIVQTAQVVLRNQVSE